MTEIIDLNSFCMHGCEGLEEEKGSIKTPFASSTLSLKISNFPGNKKFLWKIHFIFPQVFIHSSIRVCQIFWAAYGFFFLFKPISVAISSIYLLSVFLWIPFYWKCNQGSCLKTNTIRPPCPVGNDCGQLRRNMSA